MDVDFAVRRALQQQLGAGRYELWFGKGVRFELVDERLRVLTPTAFLQEWLRRNFGKAIAEVAREALGRDLSVEIQVTVKGDEGARCGGSRAANCRGPLHSPADALAPFPADEPACSAGTAAPAAYERTANLTGAAAAVSGPATVPFVAKLADLPAPCGPQIPAAVVQPFRQQRKFARFDAFVVGQCNRLAWCSARMAVERPGSVSPLLLHGPAGVGKSHLLEAILSEFRNRHRPLRSVFLTAEQFTSYFVEAVRGSGLPNFRRKYRGVDLLLIDDLQFLAGKRATLVEMLYTINTLLTEGRQVVLTADRPPGELGELGAELVNRLLGGMTCAIEPPDYAVRLEIVGRLAAAAGLELSAEVGDFVASHVMADVRGLTGAVNRLAAMRAVADEPLTVDVVRDTLGDLLQSASRGVRLRDIETAVCEVFGLDRESLQSSRRTKDVTHPRMLAMWLARKHTRAALSEIGSYFGGRKHTTVISAQQKVGAWMGQQATLRIADVQCGIEEAIRRVERRLKA